MRFHSDDRAKLLATDEPVKNMILDYISYSLPYPPPTRDDRDDTPSQATQTHAMSCFESPPLRRPPTPPQAHQQPAASLHKPSAKQRSADPDAQRFSPARLTSSEILPPRVDPDEPPATGALNSLTIKPGNGGRGNRARSAHLPLF